MIVQTGVAGIILARLVWADQSNERSRIWVVYVAVSLLAAPLWLAFETAFPGC